MEKDDASDVQETGSKRINVFPAEHGHIMACWVQDYERFFSFKGNKTGYRQWTICPWLVTLSAKRTTKHPTRGAHVSTTPVSHMKKNLKNPIREDTCIGINFSSGILTRYRSLHVLYPSLRNAFRRTHHPSLGCIALRRGALHHCTWPCSSVHHVRWGSSFDDCPNGRTLSSSSPSRKRTGLSVRMLLNFFFFTTVIQPAGSPLSRDSDSENALCWENRVSKRQSEADSNSNNNLKGSYAFP